MSNISVIWKFVGSRTHNVHSCRKLCVSGLHSKFQYAIWDMMKELDIFVENDKGLVLVGGKVYHNSEILTEEDL